MKNVTHQFESHVITHKILAKSLNYIKYAFNTLFIYSTLGTLDTL